jgi:DNA-binding CsgD family transcriptional regulator
MLHNPEEGMEHFELSVRYGMESVNLTFASIAMLTRTTNHIGDLHTLSARVTDYEDVSQKLVDAVTLNIFRIARWYVAQMKGEAGASDEIVVPLQSNRFKEALNNEVYYTCTCQIEISYLAGRYREALEWVEQGQFNTFRQTRMQVRKQHVYRSLTLAAIYAEVPHEERKGIRAKLRKQLRSMKQWSGYYGQNSSAYLLITAELLRIDGNRLAAAKGYEAAIEAARREQFGLMEAIACERSSTYYREAGSVTGADVLMADALVAYSQWGAAAKVRMLREAYPELRLSSVLFETEVKAVKKEQGQDETVLENTPFIVDEKELIRQISGWASPVDSQDVTNRFLDSAVRYSGAEKGYVLSSHGQGFSIEARAGGMKETSENILFAEAIVRYVVKTGESVVLADASSSSYAADPYIRLSQPHSVLCMPVLFSGQSLPTVLYLENNLIFGVFTKERLEVLDLMISRMVYLKSFEDSPPHMMSSDSGRKSSAIPTKNPLPLIEPLTNRETEMLYALSDGLSNKEIADRFGITEATVKTHVFHIYGKLGVKRRGQAITRARELQLLD